MLAASWTTCGWMVAFTTDETAECLQSHPLPSKGSRAATLFMPIPSQVEMGWYCIYTDNGI